MFNKHFTGHAAQLKRDYCPRDIYRNAPLFAQFTCQMVVLADRQLQILVPGVPTDVCPDVEVVLPIPRLYVPHGQGILTAYRAARYPNVRYAWRCGRWVHDCVTIDRFRPASAGGLYGWDNVGVLCPACNALKWQRWPWVDYRPSLYKRQIETYLQEKYGRQLWLQEKESPE